MADISAFITQIKTAKRGETVRDAITGAIKKLHKDGINAETLSGKPPKYFCSIKDLNNGMMNNILDNKNIYETEIVKGSNKAVESGALYDSYVEIEKKMTELLGGY